MLGGLARTRRGMWKNRLSRAREGFTKAPFTPSGRVGPCALRRPGERRFPPVMTARSRRIGFSLPEEEEEEEEEEDDDDDDEGASVAAPSARGCSIAETRPYRVPRAFPHSRGIRPLPHGGSYPYI